MGFYQKLMKYSSLSSTFLIAFLSIHFTVLGVKRVLSNDGNNSSVKRLNVKPTVYTPLKYGDAVQV